VAEDDDALMQWVRKMVVAPGMRERIKQWRGEWVELVRTGKSGQALL
jgi:hypothetical protein